jgi:putative hemolysin
MASRPFDVMQVVHRPKAVHESTSILKMFELFKRTPIQMALVIDEYGGLQGIVTLTDLIEAIAGDLPQAENQEPDVKQLEDGSLLLDGTMSIYDAQQRLDISKLPEGEFNTLAGFILFLIGGIPTVGERAAWGDWIFEVSALHGWRIDKVIARRVGAEKGSAVSSAT